MEIRMNPNPYAVLGLSQQASDEEIVSAYRRAARASHPDSGRAGSAERFQAVRDAYQVLRDPRRRALYDRSHPIGGSRATDAQETTACYLTPGSQHIVLGRRAVSSHTPPRVSVVDIDASAWLGGHLEDSFAIALLFLPADR